MCPESKRQPSAASSNPQGRQSYVAYNKLRSMGVQHWSDSPLGFHSARIACSCAQRGGRRNTSVASFLVLGSQMITMHPKHSSKYEQYARAAKHCSLCVLVRVVDFARSALRNVVASFQATVVEQKCSPRRMLTKFTEFRVSIGVKRVHAACRPHATMKCVKLLLTQFRMNHFLHEAKTPSSARFKLAQETS